MYRTFSLFALGLSLAWGQTGVARAADATKVAYPRQAANTSEEEVQPGRRQERDWRYRYQNGQWWYWAGDNGWMRWNGSRWITGSARRSGQGAESATGGLPDSMPQGAARGALGQEAQILDQGRGPETPGFNQWFGGYRGFQTGLGALQTAEQGAVEMGTGEIGGEVEASELTEFGGIPARQARAERGVGRNISGGGAWFNAGSPFGIKYGYGSGYGYGGYGFDNPYGYGSRSGSGGAYGFGFGPYGSVGGQTGERLSSLITGNPEAGRLIGSEPASIGAPARLEGPVGGTFGRAGSGARRLGGSAAGE
jgi:hypothetical protein